MKKHKTILVADDDEAVRKLLLDVLCLHGFDVQTALLKQVALFWEGSRDRGIRRCDISLAA